MPPRLLVLSDLWLPFPGGAERFVYNVAREMMVRGWAARVLTGYAPAEQFDGPPVEIAEIGVRDQHDAGARILWEQLDRGDLDAVLTHGFYAREFAEILDDAGLPVVQIVNNGDPIPACSIPVWNTDYTRVANGGAGSDLVIWPPAGDDIVADRHEHAVGFVKPLPHKGAELVYRIARMMPETRFVVLRGEWQPLEIIQEIPNVEYLEPVRDMREFWARVDLAIVPSESEDAGTVAQEATRNGLPCVSSDVMGLSETNRGGVRLVSRDPSDWVQAIERLYRNDGYRAAVVAEQTRQTDGHDWSARFDRLAEMLGRLVEPR